MTPDHTPSSPTVGAETRLLNPWPTKEDLLRATNSARGDNKAIAALVKASETYRRANPGAFMTPAIPPVNPPFDAVGAVINLDSEVIVNRKPFLGMPTWRGKVVAIGDEGLPGRENLKIRPHGSNYLSGAQPLACEVHVFDEYAWLRAEEEAARVLDRRGIDLALTLWGYFHFDTFKREAAKAYVSALSNGDHSRGGE